MEKKLIARLVGGLGNQLFGYAAARRLAWANEADLAVDDWSGFVNDVKYGRKYGLWPFAITARMASSSEKLKPFSRPRRALMKAASRRRPFSERRYITQEGGEFYSQLLDFRLHGTTFIEGVWASEDYFKDISDQIRAEFRVDAPTDARNWEIAEEINDKNSVALHVRWFGLEGRDNSRNVDAPYYRRAIDYVRTTVTTPHFFIFSDHLDDATQKLDLDGRYFTVVDQNCSPDNAHFDLWLMSRCNHFIIANSTFSWWGAWLGERPGTLVIAPDPARYPNMGWSAERFLPDRWVKI